MPDDHPPGVIPLDVTPLRRGDHDDVIHFFRAIPAGEHLFFKETISDPRVVEDWLADARGCWLVARLSGALVGVAAVVPGHGWSHHVGELRMIVSPAQRSEGIGAVLARRSLQAAVDLGLEKVTVEALAEQQGVINLFRGLGFVPEALLADQVRDADGGLHDLIVLAHPVHGASGQLEAIGAGEVA